LKILSSFGFDGENNELLEFEYMKFNIGMGHIRTCAVCMNYLIK